MSHICVIGTGYVGLVTGVCFADLGNQVVCLDVDQKRIDGLKKGIMPIYEPGLEQLTAHNVKANRLSFTTDYHEALKGAEFAFIAVGTPPAESGEAAYAELLEFVRAGAQLVFEELADMRCSAVPADARLH